MEVRIHELEVTKTLSWWPLVTKLRKQIMLALNINLINFVFKVRKIISNSTWFMLYLNFFFKNVAFNYKYWLKCDYIYTICNHNLFINFIQNVPVLYLGNIKQLSLCQLLHLWYTTQKEINISVKITKVWHNSNKVKVTIIFDW